MVAVLHAVPASLGAQLEVAALPAAFR